MRFTIKGKLIAGLAATLGLAGLVTYTGYRGLDEAGRTVGIAVNTAQVQAAVIDGKANLLRALAIMRAAELSTDPERIAYLAGAAEETRANNEVALTKTRAGVTIEEGRESLADITAKLASHAKIGLTIMAELKKNSSVVALAEIERNGRRALRASIDRIVTAGAEARRIGAVVAAGALSAHVEQGWAQPQGATAAINLTGLAERTKIARESQAKLAGDLEALLSRSRKAA